jgi:hypothetical protein
MRLRYCSRHHRTSDAQGLLKAPLLLLTLKRTEDARPHWDRIILASTAVTIGLIALYAYGQASGCSALGTYLLLCGTLAEVGTKEPLVSWKRVSDPARAD